MNQFIIASSQSKLNDFEKFKELICFKKNNDEIRTLMVLLEREMLKKNSYKSLVKKYTKYFYSQSLDWEIEYEIAKNVLMHEKNNNNLSYVFELVNYTFYYLFLPTELKCTFFLLHGVPVKDEWGIFNDVVKQNYISNFVIYKSGQELNRSFRINDETISREIKNKLNNTVEFREEIFLNEIAIKDLVLILQQKIKD